VKNEIQTNLRHPNFKENVVHVVLKDIFQRTAGHERRTKINDQRTGERQEKRLLL